MILKSAQKIEQKFPDGTKGNCVTLVGEHNGQIHRKQIKVSSLSKKVAKDKSLKTEISYQIIRCLREIALDAAYYEQHNNVDEMKERAKEIEKELFMSEKNIELIKKASEIMLND